jgi:hypothetical protein
LRELEIRLEVPSRDSKSMKTRYPELKPGEVKKTVGAKIPRRGLNAMNLQVSCFFGWAVTNLNSNLHKSPWTPHVICVDTANEWNLGLSGPTANRHSTSVSYFVPSFYI